MRWIFLECGYGKDVADAISAPMKRKMNECISFNPTKPFEKALDFVQEIQGHTSIKLFVYNQSDVDKTKQELPRTLQSVKGTANLHEIIPQPDGFIFGKRISNEPQMKLTLRF